MKNVSFYLGPAVGLTSRVLTIKRMLKAGETTETVEVRDTLGGSVETTTKMLPDNQIYQATLVDTRTTGESSKTIVLNFHTGSLQFPGPACDPSESLFRILSMEDLSSSSSVSSSSTSSPSSSLSSLSQSSLSSSSSSSSSFSVSTSSISTSSVSSSSSSLSQSSNSSSSSSSSSSSVSSGSSSSSSSASV